MCPFTQKECNLKCNLNRNNECAIVTISKNLSQMSFMDFSRSDDIQKILTYLEALLNNDFVYKKASNE